jgi:hypothetical protein
MRSAEHEGREVMVTPDEITQAITTVLESVSHLHGKLFGNLVSKVKGIPDQPVVPGRDVTVPSV